jgi:hypothetical protein
LISNSKSLIDLQNISIVLDRIVQDRTTQDKRLRYYTKFVLYDVWWTKIILVFQITCAEDKKLFRVFVEDNNFSFYVVS